MNTVFAGNQNILEMVIRSDSIYGERNKRSYQLSFHQIWRRLEIRSVLRCRERDKLDFKFENNARVKGFGNYVTFLSICIIAHLPFSMSYIQPLHCSVSVPHPFLSQ